MYQLRFNCCCADWNLPFRHNQKKTYDDFRPELQIRKLQTILTACLPRTRHSGIFYWYANHFYGGLDYRDNVSAFWSTFLQTWLRGQLITIFCFSRRYQHDCKRNCSKIDKIEDKGDHYFMVRIGLCWERA